MEICQKQEDLGNRELVHKQYELKRSSNYINIA
jgi:hypothetical protein